MRMFETAAERLSFEDPRYARFIFKGPKPLKLTYTQRGVEKKAVLQPGERFAVRKSGLRGPLMLIESLGNSVVFKLTPELIKYLEKRRQGSDS